MEQELTRRGFLAGTAMLGAGALAAGMMGCSSSDTGTAQAVEDDIAWEAEADLVIVGGGNAGFAALTTAYHENLGSALLLEAAPEEESGGNSRVSGQGVFCPKTVDSAITYQNKCNGSYRVPDELMRAWAENICENVDWMTEAIGFDPVEKGSAEFPEFDDGTGNIVWYAHEGKGPWEHTWKLLVEASAEYDAPVYYDTRAMRLVKNAEGIICGVECEDGRCFKANKGVILACGGFENNPDMMNTYMEIGFPGYSIQGTPWNRGDGIKMAMSAGADLWHMNNVSGNTLQIRTHSKDDDLSTTKMTLKSNDYIYVCNDGSRFANENEKARHGKVYRAGTWAGMVMPEVSWCIMSQEAFDGMSCGSSGYYGRVKEAEQLKTGPELLKAGLCDKCDTVSDLAAATGIPEEHLAVTIDTYNGYVEAGADPDFHREIPVDVDNPAFANTEETASEHVALLPITAPYYVVKMFPTVLNTQGGPKRGTKGEVLDVEGNPIPRLYSAGEMGCIYGYAYNLGGNFSEAISSGRLAARSASALDSLAKEA